MKLMMRLGMSALALIFSMTAAAPAEANFLVEMSYAQKFAASDVVLVGTVTAATVAHAGRYDGTATVAVLTTLKGTPRAQYIVLTQSKIPEDSPQCCEVGATYVMFLGRSSDSSALWSVNGRFGMIRIGPASSDPKVEVVPGSN
jgi:hypothetical protein